MSLLLGLPCPCQHGSANLSNGANLARHSCSLACCRMLSNLMDVLQGPATEAVDSGEEEPLADGAARPKQGGAGVGGEGAGGAVLEAAGGGAFSLWGMATALAENVKKGAADIAETCVLYLLAPRVHQWLLPCTFRDIKYNAGVRDGVQIFISEHHTLLDLAFLPPPRT